MKKKKDNLSKLIKTEMILRMVNLEVALFTLINTVDNSLLLDEDLYQDWTKLYKAVIKARKSIQ